MKRLALLLGATALALAPALRADDQQPPSAHPRPSAEERRERLQRRLERLRERAAESPSAAAPGSSTPPTPSASPGDSLHAELLKKWAALAATRLERRERHRAALLHEVGAHLSDPAVKAELALHASRVADLARIEFLAQNARVGADRQKLLARVAKASERETARHERRMTKLLAAAAPAVSGATSAGPAPGGAPSSEAPR